MVIHAGRCHPAGVKTLIVKEKRDLSLVQEKWKLYNRPVLVGTVKRQ
ncbi:hypothetical protein D917_09427 [Trichinella nativa]|uniref:Uncharacterized protein n=1 Tax=Trichinella nativa TaxID=6335 RepID=A0A1Y3EGT8_9BILA|nr:hypothetical protein D917_09427 [Trichinella nativa]